MTPSVVDRLRGALEGLRFGMAEGTRSIRAGFNSGYTALTRGRRGYGWQNITSAGINSLIQSGGYELCMKSRHMMRNNSVAAAALSGFVSNVVGVGITPKIKHPDLTVRQRLQDWWKWWCDECDATGTTDMYGLQALAVRSALEGGEVFARFRPRRSRDGMRVPLQIQLLEAEQLPWDSTEVPATDTSNTIVCGVEFNNIGRRVAYHMYKGHPGEWYLIGGSAETTRIPAKEICHLFKPLRPGQVRGQPWLTPVMLKLHELSKYDDAELVRKGLTTMLIGWTKSLSQDNPVVPIVTSDEMPAGETAPTTDTAYSILEPGAILDLEDGKDMGWYTPPSVDTSYETFMKVQLRAVAAALDVTYEMLTGDLERVNYSSIRQGVLEFRRRCEQFQYAVLVYQFCRPIWKQFLDTLALQGVISAAEYAAQPERYLDIQWMPPRWDWVDPLKDTQAEVLRVQAGFTSRSSVVESQGELAEDIDAQIAEDNERADSLGNVYVSDGRQKNTSLKGEAKPDTEGE